MATGLVRTKVTVNQAAIEQSWWRGSIYDNVKSTAEIHLELAQAKAPKRSGLLASTMTNPLTPAGNLRWRYTIKINVDYGEYTLRPTGPVIWATGGPPKPGKMWIHGPFMWVPIAKGSTLRENRGTVQGYYSDNWLAETITETFIAENLL